MNFQDFTEAVYLVSGEAVVYIAAFAIALGIALSVVVIALYVARRNL